MTAVALALASAALFGAMTVFVRLGVRAAPRAGAGAGTLATLLPATAITLLAALVAGPTDLPSAWPYALAGVVAPGLSQILFTLAIAAVGASRSSAVVGGAPLVAVAIAYVVLG